MPVAAIIVAVASVGAVWLGPRLFDVFGLVVHCAMFWFPLGLAGLVLAGVALLFLLRPRPELERHSWTRLG